MKKTLKGVTEDYMNATPHDKLDIDSFGAIIDGFLKETDVKLLVKMPEGSDDVEIDDNIGAGPVMWHYILTKAFGKTLETLCGSMLDRKKMPDYLDAIFDVVKKDVLDRLNGNDGGENEKEGNDGNENG